MSYGGHCRKCVTGTMTGPTYNSARDVLVYICGTCGYREEKPPADQRRETDNKDWVDELRRKIQTRSKPYVLQGGRKTTVVM